MLIDPIQLTNPEALMQQVQENALKAANLPPLAQAMVAEGLEPTRVGGGESVRGGGETTLGTFSNFLKRAVGEVNDKMQAAELEKQRVLTGESTNLHQAIIAAQEASVAFSLMVEVRNKLVESYQELMRMQV